MPEVSIIIRTYNEEKWIGECLRRVSEQTLQDFEVVLVDNMSEDKTVEKARTVYPELTLTEVAEYRPGLALNQGVRASSGEYFVCLSAHCVPVDEAWLGTLRENFDGDGSVAGVYGRQVPLESSDPVDKRDLLRTFGPEKRVQTRDSFFHNANSMVRREVWEQHPFDEEVTNIEDQIWANEVLGEGYRIVYEPDAAVYHHHGINQGNDAERTRNVVRTMENNVILDENDPTASFDSNPLDPSTLDIVSVIPIRQQTPSGVDSNEALLREAIEATQAAEYIDRTFVSTDAEYVIEQATQWENTEGLLRPSELSAPDVEVTDVYRYTLEHIEEQGTYPDLVVTLDITHPFRPPGFLDDIIQYLVENGYDTVIPVSPERRPCWVETGDHLERLNEGATRNERAPILTGLFSLGTVMYPHVLRTGDRLSGDLGVYEVENPLASIEIREREDLKYWEQLRELPHKFEEF